MACRHQNHHVNPEVQYKLQITQVITLPITIVLFTMLEQFVLILSLVHVWNY